MNEWTERRHGAARARAKSLCDGPHTLIPETKCVTLINQHAVDFAEVIHNDLPDALVEIERLRDAVKDWAAASFNDAEERADLEEMIDGRGGRPAAANELLNAVRALRRLVYEPDLPDRDDIIRQVDFAMAKASEQYT